MEQEIKPTGQFQVIQRLNNIRSSDFVSKYANNAAVLATFFDLNITFGEAQGVEAGVLNIEQSVKISMSLAHAKILALLLWQQVDAYEQRFGALAIPAEVMPEELRNYLTEIAARKTDEAAK